MPIVPELFNDDTVTNNPSDPSEHQRRRQAVMQAAENLAVAPHAGNRLPKALELVLADAVTINPDGTTQVRSGNHTYTITHADGCTCEVQDGVRAFASTTSRRLSPNAPLRSSRATNMPAIKNA